MTRADLRAARFITARIVRQRIRDRSAILFAILTPLGLALAFATLIPNDFSTFHTSFAVVDNDHGTLARALVDDALASVVEQGIADVREVPSETQAVRMLENSEAGAAIIIPAGFSAAVDGAQPIALRVLGGRYPVSLEVARAVVSRYASDIGAVQLLVATSSAAGASVDQALVDEAVAAAHEPSPIAIAAEAVAKRQAGLSTFYGAAMAIMFIFFATQYGSLAINSERDAGTLVRLLAAPISPAAVLLGASFAGLVLGLLSMTVLIVATTVLAGASWGSPPLLALLVLAAAVAATGLTALTATFARTPQAAGTLNAIVALSLAAIGGVFIPLSQMPSAMAALSQITPHAWFLRGIDNLSDPGAGIPTILPSLVVLVAMGAVLGAVGLLRARRSLVLNS